MKKLVSLLLCALMLISIVPAMTAEVEAESDGVYQRMLRLKDKFPDGKYWNHLVETSSDELDYMTSNKEKFAASITDHPCNSHGISHTVGLYECNYFDGGVQCYGFARYFYYCLFGERVSAGTTIYSSEGISVGDYVRVDNLVDDGQDHSAVVLSISGNTFTAVECNFQGDPCAIRWGTVKYKMSQVLHYVHASNYDTINSCVHTYNSLDICTNCGAVYHRYVYCAEDGYFTRNSSYTDTIFVRKTPYSGENKVDEFANGQTFYMHSLGYVTNNSGNKWLVIDRYVDEKGQIHEGTWYTYAERLQATGDRLIFGKYTSKTVIEETDATLGATLDALSGKLSKVTKVGIDLYNSSGDIIKESPWSTVTFKDGTGYVLFKCSAAEDLNYVLTPGTTYKYRFKAILDGKTYYSDMYTFTTTGSSTIDSPIYFGKATGEAANQAWMLETNGCVVMKIYSDSIMGYTDVKMFLYDTSGNELASSDPKSYNFTSNSDHVSFEIGADLNYTLTAGTQYAYLFRAERNGQHYYSDTQFFTTLAHTWGDWYDQSDKYHARACTNNGGVCGNEQYEAHTYGSWVYAEDSHTISCTVCGHTQTGAHSYGDWISNGGDWCYRHCSDCGYDGHWTLHPYGSWTDDGGENHKAVCANCGHIKWEAHTYGSWTRVGDNHTRSCTVCGHTQTEAHNYSAWSDDGEINHIATCSDCGYSKYSAHTYGSWVDDGSKNHKATCTVCNHAKYDDHSYNSGVITTEPGCETTGVKTYTCSVCSKTKTETVAATGHNYSSWTKISNSEHQRVCSKCSSVEKKSHTWDDGVITTPATHTQEGVKTYTCSDCNGTRTEAIDRITDHSYGQWQSYDDNQHVKSCVCGHSLYEAHTWDSGKITTAPTTTTEGERTFTCSECGDKKYVAIPPISEPIPENALLLSISDATASAGNRVSVAISVSNNPGFISMMLRVSYPTDVLTLVEVQDTGLIPGDTHSDSLTSPYTLTWNNDDTATANITTNGTLVYLVFEVADDAAEGTYEITASVPSYGILDYYADNVVSAVDAGSVTVIDYILGDVDSDGEVTPRDRMILARYLGDFEGYGADRVNFSAADIDCDGEVTPRDRMLLARHLAGMTGYESLDSFRK